MCFGCGNQSARRVHTFRNEFTPTRSGCASMTVSFSTRPWGKREPCSGATRLGPPFWMGSGIFAEAVSDSEPVTGPLGSKQDVNTNHWQPDAASCVIPSLSRDRDTRRDVDVIWIRSNPRPRRQERAIQTHRDQKARQESTWTPCRHSSFTAGVGGGAYHTRTACAG